MDKINAGDTAWVLISAGLVMLMTPGVGFFYGGLVRRKNVLTTLMHSFFILALVSVQWAIAGYSLAFGPNVMGVIGNLDWAMLSSVGSAPSQYAPTIPHNVFMLFQMMFAVVTPALIIGAFAERMRFRSMVLFILGWTTFVYAPVAHWVWSEGGWLHNLGVLDFAGGTVVHTTAGISALVVAAMLGKRVGFGQDQLDPHDLSMTVLGASFLWFGWYGFNGGSALGANGLAGTAMMTTHLSAASGALAWIAVTWFAQGRVSIFSAAAGAVAGLVAATPAAGYINPASALITGTIAGVICYLGVDFCKSVLQLDDALDVFAVHGVGGIWGMIATGIFANKAINPAGADGMLSGNGHQLVVQLIAVGAVAAFTAVATGVILLVVNLFSGLRVDERDEILGLDYTEQGEVVAGYQLAPPFPQEVAAD